MPASSVARTRRALLALSLSFVPPASAGTFLFGAGADLTSGDYGGTEPTDILYVPFLLGYETERSAVRLTVPFTAIDGPGGVVLSDGQPVPGSAGMGAMAAAMGPGGPGGGGGASGDDGRDAGLGDVVLAASYRLLPGYDEALILDVTAKVKFPTAAKTLGTGETDYALQLDLTRPIGAHSLFGALGYRWLGDSPDYEYDDVWYGNLGAEYGAEAHALGLMVDAQQPVQDGLDGRREATAYVRFALESRRQLYVYVLAGFSDASPDWGVGLNYLVRLGE
jgi:hypothetical protein